MNGLQDRRPDAAPATRLDQFNALVSREHQNYNGNNNNAREPQSKLGPGLFEHLLTGYYLLNCKNDAANKFRIIGNSIGQRYFVIYAQMLDEQFTRPTSFDECLNFISQKLWPYIFGHQLSVATTQEHENGKCDIYLIDYDYLLIQNCGVNQVSMNVLNVGMGIIESVLKMYGYAVDKVQVTFDKTKHACFFILQDAK